MHDTPPDIHGAGKPDMMVVWAIGESGSHALEHLIAEVRHWLIARQILRLQEVHA